MIKAHSCGFLDILSIMKINNPLVAIKCCVFIFLFQTLAFPSLAFQVIDNGVDTLLVQLESGTVEQPMIIMDDDFALGGQYIRVEGNNKSASAPPASGKVTLTVELAGGDYTIWGRTIARDEDSDSFWFQVNDGEIYNWNGIPITPYWGWSQVSDFRYREVVTWSLPAGTHTITVYYREPNSLLDALFITNMDAVPTRGDDQYPPNLVNLKSPPTPWQNAYNFSLPGFEFSHPMTVISGSELNMIRHYVDQQIEPQYTAYLKLIAEAEEAQSFVPDAPATMNIMGGYEPNSNLNDIREQLWRNCHAAYASALAYQFTGEAKYADKALEVMMDWANANTTFTGGDRGLQLGSWFSQVLYAADLIHDYEGYTDSQRDTFNSWWRNNVLIHTLDVLRGKDNNWKDAALLGVFTASVVLEDTLLLKEALIQLKSYFYERTDESVQLPGVDWKIKKDENGVYLPREVVRNDGRSGLTYTAYAMTSMVQCLDIAKYAGFDMWHDTTAQGADIRQLMERYFQWDILDQSFPWNGNPNKSDKRRNSYELANANLDLSPELVQWIENNRPQVAREGDEYATLTKGDIHITKLVTNIDVMDNQIYNPGDTLPISIDISDPYRVGIEEIQIKFNGETHSIHHDQNVETFIIMPDNNQPEHKVDVIIKDGFGVIKAERFTALNSERAKRLELDFDSTIGSITLSPNQPFYSPGEEVTLTAIAKFPYTFTNWAGSSSATSAEITLVMDQDYALEAVFELMDDPQLNFNFQPAHADVIDDYVPEQGRPFQLSNAFSFGWRVDLPLNGIVRNSDDTWDQRKLSYIQMQMGQSEGTSWELELTNGTYDIQVGFGDPGNLNHVNSFFIEETLFTDPDGKDAFDVYEVTNLVVSDGHLTITPAGENVKINFLKIVPSGMTMRRFLAVGNGTGSGEYAESSIVNISADPPTGTDDFEWAGDIAFVENINENATTLTMPNQDVQVVATYIPTFALTVENGTGSGNYREGAVINIEAATIEGQEFTRWSGDTQTVNDISQASTTVLMPDSPITLEAEYEVVLGLRDIENSLKVYPNPTYHEAVIEFLVHEPTQLTLEVYDLLGKNTFQLSQLFASGQHQIILDNELRKGMNVIRILKNQESISHILIRH